MTHRDYLTEEQEQALCDAFAYLDASERKIGIDYQLAFLAVRKGMESLDKEGTE